MGQGDLADEQRAVLEPLPRKGARAGRPLVRSRQRLLDGLPSGQAGGDGQSGVAGQRGVARAQEQGQQDGEETDRPREVPARGQTGESALQRG